MRKISKIVYWFALVLIVILGVPSLIGKFTSLEMTDRALANRFEAFRSFALPVAALLTLFQTIKPDDDVIEKITKIIATTCFAVIIFFILLAGVWNMCSWSDRKVLFENKNNPNEKIILRDYGCGATDSDGPSYRTFKVKRVLPFVRSVRSFDTTHIDRGIWQRVGDNQAGLY